MNSLMKRHLAIALFPFVIYIASGQSPVGTWTDHLCYNTSKAVAVTGEFVYSSTGSSILIYNKQNGELKKLTRINGLSETLISSIAWSEDKNILIIGYSNTNVDLVEKNRIYNIPDIMKKPIQPVKRINRIRISGKYAFLACSFGIVVIDLEKKEVKDTWKPGPDSDNNEVFDIAFSSQMVYAATQKGVYTAERENPGLVFFGSWDLLAQLPSPYSKYTLALFSGGKLYVNESSSAEGGDRLFVTGDFAFLFNYSPGVINNSIDPAPQGFTLSSPQSVKYFSNDGALLKEITSHDKGVPDFSQAIAEERDIWIADVNHGLIKVENMVNYIFMNVPGPVSNNAGYITCSARKTFICSGGPDISNSDPDRPFQVSVFQDNIFRTFTEENTTDASRIAVSAGNSSHFFVSSWGEGLFEYENDKLIKHYNETNSPLQKTSDNGKIYAGGLAFDKSGNLWVVQSGVNRVIKILKPDGTWIVNPLTIDSPSTVDFLISSKGLKFVLLSAGYGLLVMDDNSTPDLFSDDRNRIIAVRDNDNNVINNVFSIAEDRKGNIWLGTDKGPVVYYSNEDLFGEDPRVWRIKIARNDGSGLADYLLSNEIVTTIAVDGADRKWFGTWGSGAHLLSPDETVVLKSFKMNNSPVYSDFITSIAIDNLSGEVWFATSEGVISVREEATEDSDSYENVYVFPNPVREDFTGNVTITGLMSDSQVIITDISGNLVYKTFSTGGQASWNLSTYNGRRVSTGVYLVFCSNSDGSKAFVTKMLVIR